MMEQQGDRSVVGKSWLIQRLGAAMRGGGLTVAERASGRELLRAELERFVFKPGARGQLRLEAARGHDDLARGGACCVSLRPRAGWPNVKASSGLLAAGLSCGAVSQCFEAPGVPIISRQLLRVRGMPLQR
jgi:hypothetical protein